MEKRLPVWKNAILNIAGSLTYAVCQWLMTILVVSLGSVEEAGVLSLAMANTNMYFTLATFGLRDFQVSDSRNQYEPSEYFSTRLLTCTCSGLLCAAVVLLTGRYTAYQAACILIYMVYRISEAVVDSLQAMQQKAERMDYSCVSFLMRGLGLLAAFSLVLRATGKLLWAVAAVAAVSFAVVILWDFRISSRLAGLHPVFHPLRSLSLLRRCFPLMANSFLLAFIVALPRDLLEQLYGEYTLGIYASVAAPTVIVQQAAMWLYAPTIPAFTRAYEARDRQGFYKLYRTLWGVIAAAVAAAILAGRFLGKLGLSLFFPEEITAHADLLVPILWTTILIALCYYFSALITITRRLPVILVSNLTGAALILLFARRLIAAGGMDGVNRAVLLAMGVNALIMGAALHWFLRKRFDGEGGTVKRNA